MKKKGSNKIPKPLWAIIKILIVFVAVLVFSVLNHFFIKFEPSKSAFNDDEAPAAATETDIKNHTNTSSLSSTQRLTVKSVSENNSLKTEDSEKKEAEASQNDKKEKKKKRKKSKEAQSKKDKNGKKKPKS